MKVCSVSNCSRSSHARGFCSAHYRRWTKGQDMDKPLIPLGGWSFWDFVEAGEENECWLWSENRLNKNGYGVLSVDGSCKYAHRLSYENANGPIPPGLHVLHSCDTPRCVNPAHLSVGTAADNMRDMWAKGRGATTGAVLTEAQAVEVYHAAGFYEDIAARYGISHWQVGRIKRGQSRRHLAAAFAEDRE